MSPLIGDETEGALLKPWHDAAPTHRHPLNGLKVRNTHKPSLSLPLFLGAMNTLHNYRDDFQRGSRDRRSPPPTPVFSFVAHRKTLRAFLFPDANLVMNCTPTCTCGCAFRFFLGGVHWDGGDYMGVIPLIRNPFKAI